MPLRGWLALAAALQCGHGHGDEGAVRAVHGDGPANSSAHVVTLRDASAPFKASGTAKESWYRCADYCPLGPGEKNIVEFRCLNGACVSIGMHCNGFPNCADGSDENDCPKTRPVPHDCSEGAENWGKAWSVDKKAWCCQHKKIGCLPQHAKPHNCQEDKHQWQKAWSLDKKLWCCALQGIGCGPATTTLSSTTTATQTTATTVTSTSSTGTETATTATRTTVTATTITSTSSTVTSTTTATETTTVTSTRTTVTTTTRTTTTLTETSTTATTATITTSTSSTSTTSTPEPVAWTMSCSDKGTTYNPIDMWGTLPQQVSNVAECQALCAANQRCVHFSFWVPQRVCHLHDRRAVRSSLVNPDFISGPARCPLQAESSQLLFGTANAVVPLQRKFLHHPWREMKETVHSVAGHFGLSRSSVLLTSFYAGMVSVALLASSVLLVNRCRREARCNIVVPAAESSDDEEQGTPVSMANSRLVSSSDNRYHPLNL